MKKLPLYIGIGVAVAAVAAFIVLEIIRRNRPATLDTVYRGDNFLGGTTATQTWKGFNLNIALNQNTKNATAEITALQHLINAYNGGTPMLPITGKFDSATKAAVKKITDKTTTSLYEFNYYYLIPEKGEKAGTDILKQLTTGK